MSSFAHLMALMAPALVSAGGIPSNARTTLSLDAALTNVYIKVALQSLAVRLFGRDSDISSSG